MGILHGAASTREFAFDESPSVTMSTLACQRTASFELAPATPSSARFPIVGCDAQQLPEQGTGSNSLSAHANAARLLPAAGLSDAAAGVWVLSLSTLLLSDHLDVR